MLEGEARAQVEKDWSLFYDLSFASAIYAYYHLLPNRRIMVGPLSADTPPFEVRAVAAAYPFFAGILRVLLLLTANRAAASLEQAKRVMVDVDVRLAGGRRYLVGDRPSLSDLAFAVAMAPLIVPDEYGGALPSRDEMPSELKDTIDETRRRPSGEFALRIYRELRRPRPAPPVAEAVTATMEAT